MRKRKVVINSCYGGFGLSQAAYERLIALGVPVREDEQTIRISAHGTTVPKNEDLAIYDVGDQDSLRYYSPWYHDHRDDPLLVQVVEELGMSAADEYAYLKVVEIPNDVTYTIEEEGGMEHIAEVHRTWS